MFGQQMILVAVIVMVFCGEGLAGPTSQIIIPSTDAKGFKELTIGIANFTRFSGKSDAGPNYYDVGIVAGVLPLEKLKLEVGVDYLTTGSHSPADDHPVYFNFKLATPEDALFTGMPALAVGMFNMGTYDKPENMMLPSTRQNLAYLLAARTLPVIGRLSFGGYYGSERALASPGNPAKNNAGIMVSWDRVIKEIGENVWLGAEYMSGNNFNGEISVGGAVSFSKQVALLVGVNWYNPFYRTSAADYSVPGYPPIPGGKPTFTTQLQINLP